MSARLPANSINRQVAENVTLFFKDHEDKLDGRFVRDLLSLRLLLRRSKPTALMLELTKDVVNFIEENRGDMAGIKLIGIGSEAAKDNLPFDLVVESECSRTQLAKTFGKLVDLIGASAPVSVAIPAVSLSSTQSVGYKL